MSFESCFQQGALPSMANIMHIQQIMLRMKATFIHRKTCLNEGKEMRKSKKVKRRFLKVQGEF